MRYDAIFFDMDGTVIDSLEDIAAAVNHTLTHFGLPARSTEYIRAVVGNGVPVLAKKVVPAGTPQSFLDEFTRYYRPYYDAHCRNNTKPYPGVVPVLERLRAKGLKLAVISNKPDSAVRPLAEKYFSGLLDLSVGEKEGEVRRKPWPDAIDAAAERLAVDKSRCLYVGDSEVDVETAKNAGIDCVCVSWGFRSRQELRQAGARVIIDEPGELEKWIEG